MVKRKDGNQYQEHVRSYAIGLHILVINEDMTSLMTIASILKGASYKVMSSKPGLDITMRALQHGAIVVLDKPISKHNFMNLWQHIIHKRSLLLRTTLARAALVDKRPTTMKDVQGAKLTGISMNMARHDAKGKGKGKEKQIFEGETRDRFVSDQSGKGKEVMIGIEGSNAFPTVNVIGKGIKIEEGTEEKEKFITERKRKGINQQDGITNKVESKKQIVWNAELHKKFLQAIGTDEGKETVQQVMDEGKLQQLQAANHIQKLSSEGSQQSKLCGLTAIEGGTSPFKIGSTQPSEMPIAEIGAKIMYVDSKSSTQEKASWEESVRNSGLKTVGLGFGTGAGNAGFNAAQDEGKSTIPMNLQSRVMQIRQAYIAKNKGNIMQSNAALVPANSGNFLTKSSTSHQSDKNLQGIERVLTASSGENRPQNVSRGAVLTLEDEAMSKVKVSQGNEEAHDPQMFNACSDVGTSSRQLLDDNFTLDDFFPELHNEGADHKGSSSKGQNGGSPM